MIKYVLFSSLSQKLNSRDLIIGLNFCLWRNKCKLLPDYICTIFLRDENSYESPMKQLFELICALEPPEMPLSRLFVDLLPEKFT